MTIVRAITVITTALLLGAAGPQAGSPQALYQRGLLLYYAYDPQNAERAFAAMAALEPNDATPYWGEALALGPNINEPLKSENFEKAQHVIAQARTHIATAPQRTQDLIHALSARYAGNWDAHQSDDDAYRAAMAKLYARYPNDDDIALLYGEALAEHTSMHWTSDGKPADADLNDLVALVQTVLARNAQSVMANHLCIHAYDQAPDRAPAIACAQRLDAMTFDPQTEHLAHMPAHTWIETGAYAKAIASSRRAYALVERLQTDPTADHFHAVTYGDHDAYVGYEAAMMLGDFAQAQTWQRRLGMISESASTAIPTLVRFDRWNDILQTEDRPHDAMLAGARALAYIQLGSSALANQEIMSVPLLERETPMIVFARARLAEASGDIAGAVTLLNKEDEQQREHFEAEFVPLLPAGEALGGLYLRAHRYTDAEAAFRETLSRYPQDPRALYGLARALQGEGKPFQQTDESFNAAWSGADTTLSINEL